MIKEKKHIYCNISNVALVEFIDQDDRFTSVYNYEDLELENIHPNEWGRIETENNFFHIMLGCVRQENCPWCSGKVKILKLPKTERSPMGPQEDSRYCLQCEKCGSQGPIIFVNAELEFQESYINEIVDILKKTYAVRRPWDDGLVNQYD